MISTSTTSNTSLGYSTSTTKKYWCHICKKEFSKIYIENIEIQCSFCGGTFCEELDQEDNTSENHPSHFRPFDSTGIDRRENISTRFFSRGIRPTTTSNLLDMVIEYLTGENYEDDIETIINQIMMNDNNKYGNPPASKQSIDTLEKINITEEKLKSFGIENTCAVCKDEFTIGELCLLMPCKHHFHKDCLIPWLKERNSCPVCRYELPTDDEDFENRKKKNLNRNTSNNSRITNNVNTHDIGSHSNS